MSIIKHVTLQKLLLMTFGTTLVTNNLSAEVVKVSYTLLFHNRYFLYWFLLQRCVEPTSSFVEIFLLLYLVTCRPKMPVQKICYGVTVNTLRVH